METQTPQVGMEFHGWPLEQGPSAPGRWGKRAAPAPRLWVALGSGGVAAGLAMVTTPFAVALAWELRRYRRRGVVALSVAVMGPLCCFLALWAWTGDPAAWLDAERP